MLKTNRFLEFSKVPFFLLFLFSSCWALSVATIDYHTKERYVFYLFYFPVIMLVAWRGKYSWTIIFVLFCAIVSFFGRTSFSFENFKDSVLIWNGVIRTLAFILIGGLVHNLRQKEDRAIALQTKLEETLAVEKRFSRLDSLTGADNGRSFNQKLQNERFRSQRYKHPLSLLYLDVDEFKKINDKFGHVYGDKVLRSLAVSAQTTIREIDVFARLGGDEFVILLPETNLEGAETCRDRLQKSFAEDLPVEVKISIGVASFDETLKDNEEAIAIADKAMYAVKRNKK